MLNQTNALKERLAALHNVRVEIESIRKEAFMAAPPMPGGMPQGPPIDPNTGMPMDPSMMQGGMPPGPPIDPNTGMPMGMPPGPPIDPNTGMPMGMPPGPPIDPNTGMPMGMPMDPSMMQGGAPPQDAGTLTPEMVEELLGVIEELAANAENQEKINQELMQGLEDLATQLDDLNRRLSVDAVSPA
jgi:hypothetical protein